MKKNRTTTTTTSTSAKAEKKSGISKIAMIPCIAVAAGIGFIAGQISPETKLVREMKAMKKKVNKNDENDNSDKSPVDTTTEIIDDADADDKMKEKETVNTDPQVNISNDEVRLGAAVVESSEENVNDEETETRKLVPVLNDYTERFELFCEIAKTYGTEVEVPYPDHCHKTYNTTMEFKRFGYENVTIVIDIKHSAKKNRVDVSLKVSDLNIQYFIRTVKDDVMIVSRPEKEITFAEFDDMFNTILDKIADACE